MRFPRPDLADGNGSLTWRMVSAGVALPLLLLIIWLGAVWLTTLVALAAALGVLEYYRLLRDRALPLLTTAGLLWAVLFVVNGHAGGDWVLRAAALVVAGSLPFLILCLPTFHSPGLAKEWFLTILGPLYLGITLSYAVLLRQLDQGAQWLGLALFTAFATDTTAYFVGRALGRHLMIPRISPGKTWEGAAAGLIAGIGTALLLSVLLDLPLALWEAALLGSGVSLLAQLGDLLESALKRYAHAKDAGKLIPGHGGLLDRLDSVVLGLVLVYYGARWIAT